MSRQYDIGSAFCWWAYIWCCWWAKVVQILHVKRFLICHRIFRINLCQAENYRGQITNCLSDGSVFDLVMFNLHTSD